MPYAHVGLDLVSSFHAIFMFSNRVVSAIFFHSHRFPVSNGSKPLFEAMTEQEMECLFHVTELGYGWLGTTYRVKNIKNILHSATGQAGECERTREKNNV